MLRSTLMGVVLLAGLTGTLSEGQLSIPQVPNQFPGGAPGGGHHAGDSDGSGKLQEQAALARNSERQKKLVADTDKLLELATDLKAQVGKTNRDILSVDVIKKAEEIEKLAHNVKERMKG
jgi:hypothetical protein